MRKSSKTFILACSMMMLTVGAANAEPSRFTITNAAHSAGCTTYDPAIRKISESGEFPKQYVYQVECDSLQHTYIIVVCEGDFKCSAG